MLAERCQVLVAIPSTEDELRDYLCRERVPGDLASSQSFSMPKYRREILRPLGRNRPRWAAHGAETRAQVTLSDISRYTGQSNASAVFLVAHWSDLDSGRVELFDGMHRAQALANAFHRDWDGVLDLCVCQSSALADAVARRCQRATVKWMETPAIPTLWMELLSLTLRVQKESATHYLGGLELAMDEFRRAANQ